MESQISRALRRTISDIGDFNRAVGRKDSTVCMATKAFRLYKGEAYSLCPHFSWTSYGDVSANTNRSGSRRGKPTSSRPTECRNPLCVCKGTASHGSVVPWKSEQSSLLAVPRAALARRWRLLSITLALTSLQQLEILRRWPFSEI